MSMLEEKIRKNKDVFDGAEPPEGHLERFQQKLGVLHEGETGPSSSDRRKFFRIAAVLAALIGLSLTYYLVNPSTYPDRIAASVLPPEVHEARMYYDRLAGEKLNKVLEQAPSESEASYIRKLIQDEIILLDSNSVDLEKQLQEDQKNPKLINALIRNYKTKSDLIDDILTRLSHI